LNNRIMSLIESEVQLPWQKIVARIGFGLVLTYWLGFLPTYLTIHYMIERKFFSYDLFNDGAFGVSSFVLVAGVFVILLSVVLFGFIPLAWASYLKKKKGEEYNSARIMAWVFIVVAVIFHFILFAGSLHNNKLTVYFAFSFLGLITCVFFCSFVGRKFKENVFNWAPSAFFILFTAALPLLSREMNSQVVSQALRAFRIGGMIDVVALSKMELKEIVSGKLILQTPQNLYVENANGELVTVPYSHDIVIKVSKFADSSYD
jgi:hypothetical protein